MATRVNDTPWPNCGDTGNITFGTWDVTGSSTWNNSVTNSAGTINVGLIVLNVTLKAPLNIAGTSNQSLPGIGEVNVATYTNNVSATGYETVKEICGEEVNMTISAPPAVGNMSLIVIKTDTPDKLVKVCSTPTTQGGEVECIIAYLHIGTKNVRNITFIDYLPPGFTYINITELTNISEILNQTGIQIPSDIGVPGVNPNDYIKLANRAEIENPECGEKGNISIGIWEMNTTSVPVGNLSLNLVVGLVGFKIKLKAPTDLSDGTPVSPIGGLDAVQYQNNITVNAAEVDTMCGDLTIVNNITKNSSDNITVVKVNLTDNLIKICPVPTTPGGEVSCLLLYVHIGFKDLTNITFTDNLPEGFEYVNATLITNISEILNMIGVELPLNLGVDSVSTAHWKTEKDPWPNPGATGNITFGTWEKNSTTFSIPAVGNLSINIVIIGLNVTLKAPEDLSGGTPIGNISVGGLSLPAVQYENNATVNASEVDRECGNETYTDISTKDTANITVVKIEGINKAIKVCIPPLTMTDKNVSCLIA
ncbi:MAG: hypothetical protein ACK4YO_03360, partial [Candidatus Altarchaeaceae archaeon]